MQRPWKLCQCVVVSTLQDAIFARTCSVTEIFFTGLCLQKQLPLQSSENEQNVHDNSDVTVDDASHFSTQLNKINYVIYSIIYNTNNTAVC